MKRNIELMSQGNYDLIVIGGGITGACVAWDASLRGLKVALLEKKDFSHATSSATSKLIHGGIRYLKNAEFHLVRESLRERRIMEIIAPHLVYPLPFLIPTYGWGTRGIFLPATGVMLYELLSFDKNRLEDDDKKVPPFKIFSKSKVLNEEPNISPVNLTGGVVYYDCQVYSPERLTIEFILSSAKQGADIANYAEVINFIIEGKTVKGVYVKDVLTDKTYQIKGKMVANVAGPWADIVLGFIQGAVQEKMVRSKGIHIITRPITNKYALLFQTPTKRHFFIIPWRGHSLIGTTDKEYRGNPDDFKVPEQDITEFIDEVNTSYPSAKLTRDDVLFFYGGLRPIVEKETEVKEVYSASRRYEIYDHEKESGIKGLMTVIGGKYTTSRSLAKQLVDTVLKKISKVSIPCKTHITQLHSGEMKRYADFVKESKKRFSNIPEPIIENLCRNYGTNIDKVLSLCNEDNTLIKQICNRDPDIFAEVIYGIRNEMALTLSDIIFRRTGLGTLGNPGDNVIEQVADIMAKELNWDNNRKNREIENVISHFIPLK